MDDQVAGPPAGVPAGGDAQAAGQHGAHLGTVQQRVGRVYVAGQVIGDQLQGAALAVEQLRAAHDEAVPRSAGAADAVGQVDLGRGRVEHPAGREFVRRAAGLGVQRHREPPADRGPAVIAQRLVGDDLGRHPEPGRGPRCGTRRACPRRSRAG